MSGTPQNCGIVVSPHADDAAAFCGATLAKLADEGWRVVLVRVTDDRKDSVGLTVEETTARNTEELHRAAEILGVSEIIELGFENAVGTGAKRARAPMVYPKDAERKTRNLLDYVGSPGLFVEGATHGTIVSGSIIEDTGSGRQRIGIRICAPAG